MKKIYYLRVKTRFRAGNIVGGVKSCVVGVGVLHLGALVTQCGPTSAGGITTVAAGVLCNFIEDFNKEAGVIILCPTHKLELQ